MYLDDLVKKVGEVAELDKNRTQALIEAFFSSIARELSVGESVDLEGFGRFLTVKYPSRVIEDPPGSGKKAIIMSKIEPEFEPGDELIDFVSKAQKEHPEWFVEESKEDDEDAIDQINKPDNEPDLPHKSAVEPEVKPEVKIYPDPKPIQAPPSPEPAAQREDVLGKASNIEFRDISHLKIDKEVLGVISEELARRYSVAPIDLKEGVLILAMIDPEDFDTIQTIRKETELEIKPVLTTREDLNTVLDQYTGLQAEVQDVIDHADLGISSKEIAAASQEDIQDQTNENAPTAKIVYSLLRRAVKERASDVHIEPYEHKEVVRFRIDGVLQVRVELPKEIESAVVSRLKILSNLKIDEQRLPQDGRFSLVIDHRQVDFRLSTMPMVYGEKVVMRILDKSVGIISLEDVGLADRGLRILEKNMQRSHGMILVTGPTGSGKTTSLYAVLGKLMNETVNILTLEDPVEYRIESINQSQVHPEIGYTFASGLRSVVRQDPDIVMLGEIRDQETADMAIHAALTGHVVLSTLHTNDSAGAFPRLIDMQIEPFLITSSVHTVIAQRLARKICDNCKEEIDIPAEEMKEVEAIIDTMPEEVQTEIRKNKRIFYHGKGCDRCGGKGYIGRLGIFEVLDVSEDIRNLILKRSSGSDITNQAIKEGMVTMVQDGIVKALRGMTTLEEVWRVTKE